jgi:hypothetical protein
MSGSRTSASGQTRTVRRGNAASGVPYGADLRRNKGATPIAAAMPARISDRSFWFKLTIRRQHPSQCDQSPQAPTDLRIPSALRYCCLRPSPVLELTLPYALDPLGLLGASAASRGCGPCLEGGPQRVDRRRAALCAARLAPAPTRGPEAPPQACGRCRACSRHRPPRRCCDMQAITGIARYTRYKRYRG